VKPGLPVASAIRQVTTGAGFGRVASSTEPQFKVFESGMTPRTMSKCGMAPCPARFGVGLATPGRHQRARWQQARPATSQRRSWRRYWRIASGPFPVDNPAACRAKSLAARSLGRGQFYFPCL